MWKKYSRYRGGGRESERGRETTHTKAPIKALQFVIVTRNILLRTECAFQLYTDI